MEIERAHRHGKVYRGCGTPRPRHILIKSIVINILKNTRQALKDAEYRLAENLRKTDLEENRNWREEVA